MPALINCHTHLYSTLARGISLTCSPPRNFSQILKKLWWRLDRALNEDDIYYSALVGLIDSAKNGVGTLVDQIYFSAFLFRGHVSGGAKNSAVRSGMLRG